MVWVQGLGFEVWELAFRVLAIRDDQETNLGATTVCEQIYRATSGLWKRKRKLLFRVKLGSRVTTPIMKNHMEKNMVNYMQTGLHREL